MSNYTPTTGEVREAFWRCMYLLPDNNGGLPPMYDPWNVQQAFDRWLAAHDAEMIQRGREAAAQSIVDNVSHAENCRQEPHPYWACDCGVSICVAFARTDNPFAAHGEADHE